MLLVLFLTAGSTNILAINLHQLAFKVYIVSTQIINSILLYIKVCVACRCVPVAQAFLVSDFLHFSVYEPEYLVRLM